MSKCKAVLDSKKVTSLSVRKKIPSAKKSKRAAGKKK
jgi:hypothetical protein